MYVCVASDQCPFLVTGNKLGHIAVWNLEKRKLHTIMYVFSYTHILILVCSYTHILMYSYTYAHTCRYHAHDKAVVSMYFLPNEPILITSGADNSIKVVKCLL